MLSNEAIHQQVENLLSQMTLEEKAAQMVQVPYTVVGRGGRNAGAGPRGAAGGAP